MSLKTKTRAELVKWSDIADVTDWNPLECDHEEPERREITGTLFLFDKRDNLVCKIPMVGLDEGDHAAMSGEINSPSSGVVSTYIVGLSNGVTVGGSVVDGRRSIVPCNGLGITSILIFEGNTVRIGSFDISW